MLPRLLRTRALLGASTSRNWRGGSHLVRRTLIAAPRPGDGPLMSRRADRELPEIPKNGMRWARTIPIFLVILVTSTLAIFNYQKSSSSVVSSTLYSLRTSPKAREYLGDEIYFAHKIPWIWGEMNQLQGRIDIQFEVKGKRGQGTMRFTSHRKKRQGVFVTSEWSLEVDDGRGGRRKVDLLDDTDTFRTLESDPEEVGAVGRGSYAPNLSA